MPARLCFLVLALLLAGCDGVTQPDLLDDPAPSLLAPTDGFRTTAATSIMLRWTPVDEATAYDIEITPLDLFDAASMRGRTTRLDTTIALGILGRHTWRVRAVKDGHLGRWGSPRTLVVDES